LAANVAVYLEALSVVTTARGAINELHVLSVTNPETARIFRAFHAGRVTAPELHARYVDFQAGQVERPDRWFCHQRRAYFTSVVAAI